MVSVSARSSVCARHSCIGYKPQQTSVIFCHRSHLVRRRRNIVARQPSRFAMNAILHSRPLPAPIPSGTQLASRLSDRYGDFILMKPPVQPNTWLLWLAPFVVLGAGGAIAWVTVKKAGATKT